MKLFDLDYFRTADGIIFIVKGNIHPKGKVFAYPVYWPSNNGDRFCEKTKIRYEKRIDELFNKEYFDLYPEARHEYIPQNIPAVDSRKIVEIFRPQEAMKKFKNEMTKTIWWQIYRSLIEISGIDQKNIGVFGSYLVGLSQNDKKELIKDIDFVVYGKDSCQKLKKSQQKIKDSCGLGNISTNHIKYEVKKLGHGFNQKRNSFAKMLGNKWSSIQVADGILTTIRFVDKEYGVLQKIPDDKKTISLIGEVAEDFYGSFVPRSFTIKTGKKHYKIVTFYWIYHQALAKKQKVQVWGYLFGDNVVILDSINHGVKIS